MNQVHKECNGLVMRLRAGQASHHRVSEDGEEYATVLREHPPTALEAEAADEIERLERVISDTSIALSDAHFKIAALEKGRDAWANLHEVSQHERVLEREYAEEIARLAGLLSADVGVAAPLLKELNCKADAARLWKAKHDLDATLAKNPAAKEEPRSPNIVNVLDAMEADRKRNEIRQSQRDEGLLHDLRSASAAEAHDGLSRLLAQAADALDEAWERNGVYRAPPPLWEPSPVPEGWVMVPIEPTEEMHQAASREWDGRISARCAGVWEAMVAAAPKYPPSQSTNSKEGA